MVASVSRRRREGRCRLGAAVLCLTAGVLASAASAGGAISRQAGPGGVVLSVELPAPRLTGRPDEPLRWPGFLATEALPLLRLPVTGALVPVPARGPVRLELLEERHQDLPLPPATGRLLPRPGSTWAEEAAWPPRPVRMDPPAFLGPQRVVRVRFRPAQVLAGPEGGRLRVYRRLVVALRFEGLAAGAAGGPATSEARP